MTTLTAHNPRLHEHCPHKLPTSCRMSAPLCCACSDKRSHSSSYSKYIDGIGFVSQGSRHQDYCSYCRDFWIARIASSDLPSPSEARIPSIPDQTTFIERWFEWHRAYISAADGHGDQELRGSIGESFDQVPPGYLPRTTDELAAHRLNPSSQHYLIPSDGLTRIAHNTPSLDIFGTHNTSGTGSEVLNPENRLFDPSLIHSSYQARHSRIYLDSLIALRSELHRIRTGIEQVMSGLQELGETPPNSQEALRQSGALDNRINAIDRQFHDLRQTRMSGPQLHDATTTQSPRNPPTNQHEAVTASSNRITASTAMANIRANFDAVEGREVSAQTDQDNTALALQHAGNEVQAASNARRELLRVLGDQQAAERVFGTHEEGERQGVDYESPVGGVFNRASVRYRVAEEARRGERSERTEEREPANDRARQRPQEVGRRSGGSSEAGGTQFYFTPIAPIMPSQSLQPNLTRSQFYTMQNQNQGQFSGSPPHLSSGANNPLHSQRLPPFSGTSQHFTLQGNTTVQPQPNGQPMAQHPQCIENHEAQRERMIAEGSHYFSTYGPGRPNATPTMNPSTTTYPAVRPFIPQIMSHPIVNPHTTAPPGQFDGAHQRSTSFAMPDFSTIAPEAARMQDVASQAQRRIIRDIRARRLDTPPPTTPGRFDSNVSPLTSVPYDLDPLRATANRISRSEDGASDSSDARDRLRRRRNAIGETDDTRPPIRPSTTAEAVEAAIANFRVRRHAGLATAVDQLVEGDISAVEQAPRGLDRNDGRPEPRTTEEMMVNMECKICFAQLATVAVLPCGHCVMCKWCADQTVPSHKADRTKPATQVSCPICRKRVKQKANIFMG